MRTLELAVVPLDAARRTTLRLATRSALLTRLLGRRDSRVACLASLQVTVLFGLAVTAPVALFFLGPVLFGVVHLAADVRYLVARRAPPRALMIASALFALGITAAEAGLRLGLVGSRRAEPIEVALGVAWVGFALAASVRDAPRRAVAAAPLFLGAAWALVAHAHLVGIVLVHGHNLVAILAWLLLFRRRSPWTLLPIALIVAFAAVLLSGVYLPWTIAHGGGLAFGMRAERLGAWLAPGAGPELAVAVAATFVFLQGVHYAAWTGWIPQDDLRTEGTPTYRMSVRALTKDFGPTALALIAGVAIAFVGLAGWNVRESVGWYLTLAKSHAWFECAFVGYFALRRGRFRAIVA